jgi:hypothetical protein
VQQKQQPQPLEGKNLISVSELPLCLSCFPVCVCIGTVDLDDPEVSFLYLYILVCLDSLFVLPPSLSVLPHRL